MHGSQYTKCKHTQRVSGPDCPTRTVIFGAVAAFGLVLQQPSFATGQDNDYQNALLSPSNAMLRAERRGRVTIFDGLEHAVIDRALDSQFDRIGNMMFVNTKEKQPDGTVEADDDC